MRQVSSERKVIYYIGIALTVVGFLLFISTFFNSALHFGDFRGRSMETPGFTFMRAVLGLVLVIVGGILRNIGVRGLAGSGIVLDPERAQQDLEPWARTGGGLIKNAMDEMGATFSHAPEMPFDEKLRRLESLKNDGLITDAEYQAKRSEVLNTKL